MAKSYCVHEHSSYLKKEKVQLNGNKTGENNEIPQLQQLRRILSLQVNGGVHIHAYSCI